MDDLNVIDQFMQTFILYIDSGFGLLNGDVAALTSILIAIDVTLAALFWVLDAETNVFARLIKKVLYIGAFAFILNNFSELAEIIFNSFSGLGLQATNNNLTPEDLLRPGQLASTGFEAAWPLLEEAGSLVGFTTIINHGVTILVLLSAWFIVVLLFFILAVQLFITILEFKLTTLAGFVLVPFAFWNKTSFLAERVLGNVVASGIKVMVLAVIVGIGTTIFGQFIDAFAGEEVTLSEAMSLVLASLALFGLGIFGPGIAAGLVSGAPQLGAGAAIGTAGALAGGAVLGGAAAVGGARALGGGTIGAIRAGTALSGGASRAYGLARASSGTAGLSGVGAGLAGVARAGASAVGQGARRIGRPMSSTSASASGVTTAAAASTSSVPTWARRLQAEQRRRGHSHTVAQAIKDGDRSAPGLSPSIREEER